MSVVSARIQKDVFIADIRVAPLFGSKLILTLYGARIKLKTIKYDNICN